MDIHVKYVMKIIGAMGTSSAMTEEETDRFLLESKLNLQLATNDEMGDPNIHPVWFKYDKDEKRLFVITSKMSKKVQNIRKKSNVYFSIDDENPYRGVKGKGVATLIENPDEIMPKVEKINLKYLGTLDDPTAKMMIESTKSGINALIDIKPKFFSTWDLTKEEEGDA
jgi:general stress protein 26